MLVVCRVKCRGRQHGGSHFAFFISRNLSCIQKFLNLFLHLIGNIKLLLIVAINHLNTRKFEQLDRNTKNIYCTHIQTKTTQKSYRCILCACVILLCIQCSGVMELKEKTHKLLKHFFIARVLEIINLHVACGPTAHFLVRRIWFRIFRTHEPYDNNKSAIRLALTDFIRK